MERIVADERRVAPGRWCSSATPSPICGARGPRGCPSWDGWRRGIPIRSRAKDIEKVADLAVLDAGWAKLARRRRPSRDDLVVVAGSGRWGAIRPSARRRGCISVTTRRGACGPRPDGASRDPTLSRAGTQSSATAPAPRGRTSTGSPTSACATTRRSGGRRSWRRRTSTRSSSNGCVRSPRPRRSCGTTCLSCARRRPQALDRRRDRAGAGATPTCGRRADRCGASFARPGTGPPGVPRLHVDPPCPTPGTGDAARHVGVDGRNFDAGGRDPTRISGPRRECFATRRGRRRSSRPPARPPYRGTPAGSMPATSVSLSAAYVTAGDRARAGGRPVCPTRLDPRRRSRRQEPGRPLARELVASTGCRTRRRSRYGPSSAASPRPGAGRRASSSRGRATRGRRAARRTRKHLPGHRARRVRQPQLLALRAVVVPRRARSWGVRPLPDRVVTNGRRSRTSSRPGTPA